METILIIEDEAAIADTLIYALETEGFQVEWVTLGREGVARIGQGGVALAVLDVGLPDGNGFEFCKEIRRLSELPVIFLTARNAEVDRIVGLEIGGDDYVTKPFSPREVAARVKAILRRARPDPALPRAESAAGFDLESERALIRYNGQPLELTRTEYLILKALLHHPGAVFTRGQLMQYAWEEPGESEERAVDTHIKGIRAELRRVAPQLEPGSEPLKTHRGIGYSIDGPVREG